MLRIYDANLPLTIQTDASKSGLGSVLLQEGQPIAFASRSLTKSEEKYAQIEKELLAIVFACDKFHHFVYGREVDIQSDHKPLETLVKKELDDVSSRLQRMFLMLLRYPGIKVKYTPGKTVVIADCLSRAYQKFDGPENEELKYVVHTIKNRICASQHNYRIYKEATSNDEELKSIIKYLQKNWPKFGQITAEQMPYYKIKNELSYEEGLLLFHDKIVVPKHIRKEILSLVHEPHLGIEKTLGRARNLFFWPGMSTEIEKLVSDCQICEKYKPNNVKEPLVQEENTSFPWERASMDIYEYGGKSYLVIIDAYSGWIHTEKLKDKCISTIVRILTKLFNIVGNPAEIRTDNSPFNSAQMHQFANKYNIKLYFSSPHYSQSNGLAEKAVSIAKKILKKSIDQGLEEDLGYRILEYNATPVSAMGLAPSELFLGRLTKTKIPVTNKKLVRNLIPETIIQSKISEKKQKQKMYYDKTAKPMKMLNVSDKIMFKKDMNKNSVWYYGKVARRLGDRTYIVQDSLNRTYRRNRKFIVKTNNSLCRDIDYDFNVEITGNPSDNNIEMGFTDPPENITLNNNTRNIENSPENDTNNNQPVAHDVQPNTQLYTTRAGREVRPVDRYGDWVEH